ATEAELIDDVFFFNAMGQDDANGVFTLKNDEIDLNWPDDKPIANQPCFVKIEEIIRKLSAAMGEDYTPLPTSEGLGRVCAQQPLIGAHAVGVCRVGATMAEGGVSDVGRGYGGRMGASDPRCGQPGCFSVYVWPMPGGLPASPTWASAAQTTKATDRAV